MGPPLTIRVSRTEANSLVSSLSAGLVYRLQDEVSYRACAKACHVVG
jgi:hypothetical protein